VTLVCLHGFMDTPRTWALVLPALERHHTVLTPTFPGHAGGPPIEGQITMSLFADAIERELDAAGIESAHFAGNSLGGFVALQLAARGRADSVVALAPAGGWSRGDSHATELLRYQKELHALAKASAAYADAIVSTAAGRRRATALMTTNFEHIPPQLIVDLTLGVAGCTAAPALADFALHADWELDAEQIRCPVRIAWGTADRLLEWPRAAVRYREEWLPHADWIELEDVGHAPQLDVPSTAAELIVGFTGAR
jgi:pimeloyl-ACP methyl ester carboxylesterase